MIDMTLASGRRRVTIIAYIVFLVTSALQRDLIHLRICHLFDFLRIQCQDFFLVLQLLFIYFDVAQLDQLEWLRCLVSPVCHC